MKTISEVGRGSVPLIASGTIANTRLVFCRATHWVMFWSYPALEMPLPLWMIPVIGTSFLIGEYFFP